MNIRQAWRRITTSNYSRELETELERARVENLRLRAENRALLNSILGIAGVPPLPASVADLVEVEKQSELPPQFPSDASVPGAARPRLQKSATRRKSGAGVTGNVVSPTRRRSWQQINRMLEFECAQKEKTGAEPLGDAHM
jgi:hypothetical protein